MARRGWLLGACLFAIAALVGACARLATLASAPGAERGPAASSQPSGTPKIAAFGRLPLHFEENRGQADPSVRYLARGQGYGLFLTPRDVVLRLGDESVRITLLGGGDDVNVSGFDELPGRVNYLVGRDPSTWQTGLPTYAKVRYRGVYPGIDVVLYGNQRQLEYDFVVAPGADPSRIRFQISGVAVPELGPDGDVRLATKRGTVIQRKPVVYQEIDGARIPVHGGYVMRGPREVGFHVAAYDRTRPLVIDPVVSYATYLGGSDYDFAEGVAIDAAGNAYIAGKTASTNFPGASGVQPTKSGGYDAFVAKLNASGTSLLYATYLGGSLDDSALGIAVDGSGNAYVAGVTSSTDFPTVNAIQATNAGGTDAFVAKLNATGSALVYSTYLGGTGTDDARGIAVDANGNAYIAGATASTTFPTTPGVFQAARTGPLNPYDFSPYVTKLTAVGALAWSTYVGKTGWANGIAVDGSGSAYITGTTSAFDFPTTPGAFQTSNMTKTGESSDTAFVTKLSPDGSSLVYSTYLGGGSADEGVAIAVSSGYAHVTGLTSSADFPTVNAIQTSNADGNAGGDNPAFDGFVAKLNPSGTGVVFSTYLGGTGGDSPQGIAVDGSGNVYVTGQTTASNFPAKDAMSPFVADAENVFVTKLDPAGALVYSTPVGSGTGYPAGGIAADASGNAYVVSAGSPLSTTPGAFQTSPGGIVDAFVVKLAPGAGGGGGGGGDTTPPTVTITKPASGAWTGGSINVSASATDNVALASIKLYGNGGVFGTLTCSGATCSGTVTWITGSLPPAAYQVQAVATDTAGNSTTSAPITIYKDATSPTVPSGAPASGGGGGGTTLSAAITSPSNGATVSGPVTVNMTATNAQGSPTRFLLKLDNATMISDQGATGSSASATWNTAGVANGSHTLNLTVTDGAGRSASTAVTVTVNNPTGGGGGDTTPPTVSITSPPSGAWTGGSINVSASATDNVALASIKLYGNGGVFGTLPCSGATCSGTVTWVTGSLPPAAYQVQAVATDTSGNSTTSAPVTINKDATSPTVASGAPASGGGGTTLAAAITSPSDGATVSGPVTVSMTATNAQGSPTRFLLKLDNATTLSDQSVAGSSASATWDTGGAASGSHTLNLTVTDGAGRSASAAVTVTVNNPSGGGGGDTTPPTVAITKPSNGAWTGNSIDIIAAGSDNVGLTSIAIYGGGALVQTVGCGGAASCNTGTVWWSTGALPPGQHTITAVATDTSGNKTTSAPVTINK